jgi:hypothetical protein
MAMQIMIDHDLGYTTDAAKGDFGAAKDHPLASAAYLELGGQNSGVFSPDEQAYMQDAVLKHSYPFGLDKPLDFTNNKEQAIANLISIVDAMGVTANTKCPALYREVLTPEIMQELAMDDGPEIRKNLHAIIDQAVTDGKISPEAAEGYHMALDYDASQWGAKNMILQQFGGQLLGTTMEDLGNRQYSLYLDFGVSQDIELLATLFGGRGEIEQFNNATKAFGKMVGDLPFQPFPEELAAAEAKRAEKRAAGTREEDLPPMPTVTDLGARARMAEEGHTQNLSTGGAVRITLRKLR